MCYNLAMYQLPFFFKYVDDTASKFKDFFIVERKETVLWNLKVYASFSRDSAFLPLLDYLSR